LNLRATRSMPTEGGNLMRCTAGLKMACVREISGRGMLSNALHKGFGNLPDLFSSGSLRSEGQAELHAELSAVHRVVG